MSINIYIQLFLAALVQVGLAAGGPAGALNATAGNVTAGLAGNVTVGNATAAGGAGQNGRITLSPARKKQNQQFYAYLEVTYGGMVALVFIYRIVLKVLRYIRQLTSLDNPTQRYFSIPNDTNARIKQHLLYAPVGRRRHNREIKLSAATNFGTLPSRFQALFLVVFLAINIALCVVSIDWDGARKEVLVQIRHRTGVLAVANMLPLFILAGRNNPLIPWLGMSFDTFNMIHRWFGRLVVVESVTHTAAYMTSKIESSGWAAFWQSLVKSELILGGSIGTIAFVAILFQSPSVVRHAFYETFLHAHQAMALLSVVGLWMHLKELDQMPLLVGIVVLWIIERLLRVFRLVYRNIGHGGTRAIVQVLPGEAMRVTLDLARPWTFRPGQHVYLYMPSVGMWTSHPFTVAWSEEKAVEQDKEMTVDRKEILELQKTSLSLVIRRRTGFTDRLYRKAEQAKDGQLAVRAFVEGPYGGVGMLHSYGTVMLFAGGIGITHQVPHVRDLVTGFGNGTVAARKVILVWVIQSPEHLEWIRPWMTTILAMEGRRDILKIMLFVTRPRTTQEIRSPSSTVQMLPGRPDIDTLIDLELQSRVGAMAVSVCGTGSLSDDVRHAVRRRQSQANLDFFEEAFTW